MAGKKRLNQGRSSALTDEILKKDTDPVSELYGQIEEAVGDRRFKIKCENDTTMLCQLAGHWKPKVFKGDFVLVQLWDDSLKRGKSNSNERQGTISMAYSRDLAKSLRKHYASDPVLGPFFSGKDLSGACAGAGKDATYDAVEFADEEKPAKFKGRSNVPLPMPAAYDDADAVVDVDAI